MIYGGKFNAQPGYNSKPAKAFEHEGITFFGSSRTVIPDMAGEHDLVINIGGNQPLFPQKQTNYNALTKSPEGFDSGAFAVTIVHPDEFLLDWKDYGVPLIQSSFWHSIAEFIKDRQYNRVFVGCTAGIGRTGTVLSILYGVLKGVTADIAINAIRSTYRKDAVETDEQVNLVAKVCGAGPNMDNVLGSRSYTSFGSHTAIDTTGNKYKKAQDSEALPNSLPTIGEVNKVLQTEKVTNLSCRDGEVYVAFTISGKKGFFVANAGKVRDTRFAVINQVKNTIEEIADELS